MRETKARGGYEKYSTRHLPGPYDRLPAMSEDYRLSTVYLYKPPESANFTNSWVYYRVESIRGPNEPGGTLNAPIQMCRVAWPSFADIPPVTETPGVTGLTSAYEQMCKIAKSQWGVEHQDSVEIGILE